MYRLYGLRIASDFPLPAPKDPRPGPADIRLTAGTASGFARFRELIPDEAPFGPLHRVRTRSGLYLQWEAQAEFLIGPRGRTIAGRPLMAGSRESFRAGLLTQVLSFALLERGTEHLHATVVTVGDVAVAFAGQPGAGKSTLAAAFVAAGDRLTTDDILVLAPGPSGFVAQPAYPRLRLWPEAAQRLLPDARTSRLSARSPKLVVALPRSSWSAEPMPLARIYVLGRPATDVRTAAITGIRAFRALGENTYNTSVTEPERIRRHFGFTASVAGSVPMARLWYPRRFGVLGRVRERVLADMGLA